MSVCMDSRCVRHHEVMRFGFTCQRKKGIVFLPQKGQHFLAIQKGQHFLTQKRAAFCCHSKGPESSCHGEVGVFRLHEAEPFSFANANILTCSEVFASGLARERAQTFICSICRNFQQRSARASLGESTAGKRSQRTQRDRSVRLTARAGVAGS